MKNMKKKYEFSLILSSTGLTFKGDTPDHIMIGMLEMGKVVLSRRISLRVDEIEKEAEKTKSKNHEKE